MMIEPKNSSTSQFVLRIEDITLPDLGSVNILIFQIILMLHSVG